MTRTIAALTSVLFLSLLVLPVPSRGEDDPDAAAPGPAEQIGTEAPGGTASAAESPAPAPTPAAPVDVLPLDEWHPIEDDEEDEPPPPRPSPSNVATPEPTATPVPTPPPTGYGPHSFKEALTKSQLKRLKRAERIRRRIVLSDRKRYPAKTAGDRRGEPEIRICAADSGNYGHLTDFKRLMRPKGQKERKAFERTLANAVKSARCDVVVLQALYGASFARAAEALAGLAAYIEKRTGVSYRPIAEEIRGQQVWTGFLVRRKGPESRGVRLFNSVTLPIFGVTDPKDPRFEKHFPRSPVALTLEVQGSGEAEARPVVIVSFDLRRSLVGKPPDAEALRMQLAEALRTLIDDVVSESDPRSIIVAVGERSAPAAAPSSQILAGRLRLRNFMDESMCKLDEDGKAVCAEVEGQASVLFGLLESELPPPPAVRRVMRDGKAVHVVVPPSAAERRARRLRLRTRTTDIYLPQRFLQLAYRDSRHPGYFVAGEVPVKNGRAGSPLVWVELNWE